MKKYHYALLSLALIGATKSYAQTGNFGIGTTTPASKLTVNGSFGATYNNITSATYTMTAADYYLAWNGTSAGTVTLPAAVSGTGNYKGRIYHIKNTSTAQTLTVAANGSELLDAQTGAGVASISLPAGYFATLVSTGNTSGTTWEVAIVANSSPATSNWLTTGNTGTTASTAAIGSTVNNNFIGTTDSKDFVIASGNQERMRITSGGNIGISNNAPSGKIEITSDNQGNGSGNDIYFNGYGTSKGTALFLGSAGGTATAPANLTNGDEIGFISFNPRFNGNWGYTSAGASIFSYYKGNGTTGLGDLRLRTSGAERVIVDENGKVGINTTTPGAQLHLNGNMILGTASSTNGGTGYSTVVRDNTTGELKVAASSTGNTFPINSITYTLSNVNGDWVNDYDTKISSTDYTMAVVGSSYTNAVNALAAANGDFNPINVYAYKSGTTWHLYADYVNAGPATGGGNGTWTFYCLVINNSLVKTLTTVSQNLGGTNSGAAASAPSGL